MDTDTQEKCVSAAAMSGDYARSRKGRLQFKVSKSRNRPSSGSAHDWSHRYQRQRYRHRHTHSSKHSRYTRQFDGDQQQLSPEEAFRESLFDALGDDEGAEYWAAVYGQPIHTYNVPSAPRGPQGELEQMSEEEYAAYVRSKMWERTRDGMMEEQERLRQERLKQKRRERKNEHIQDERARLEHAMDESLRRGRERRRRKAFEYIWDEYGRRWAEIDQLVEVAKRDGWDSSKPLRNLLFWPVESGRRKDVSRSAVEEFMRNAHAYACAHTPAAEDERVDSGHGDALLTTLKSERIRWHPDKIQHRYGVLGVDDVVIRTATEVFQIVDHMWSEMTRSAS